MTPPPNSDRRLPAGPRVSWLERIGLAAFDPDDDADLRLRKSFLLLTAALTNLVASVWLAVYWLMGVRLPTSLPLGYQVASAVLLVYFLRTRDFRRYRFAQLALFLVMPFAVQWSIGNFLASSGVALLALLGPVCALVVAGPRESLRWFAAFVVLMAGSATLDFVGTDGAASVAMRTMSVPLRTVAVFFALNATILAAIVYYLLRVFTLQKAAAQDELGREHALLVAERTRSDALLASMMPAWVADRLKRDHSIIADGHADICVMFADIVGFTRLSGRLEPRQVIGFLNHVFTRLDHLCARHGLEKIKTVGDAYMVVGGLGFSEHDYVAAMADMATDIHSMVRTDPIMSEHGLAFHVGIATGPAVAGVIGVTRLSYDVWGDTVNLAARVTEDSAPGTILVDRATYVRLSDRYLFEEPREVVYKGKGLSLVFQLVGRRAATTGAATRAARVRVDGRP